MSFVSLNAYERVITLSSINEKLKKQILNILSLPINKNIINMLDNTISICDTITSLNQYVVMIINTSNNLLHDYQNIKLEDKKACVNSTYAPSIVPLLDLIDDIDSRVINAKNTINEYFTLLKNYKDN